MDDSDLALDMALERLDESSDIEEDSQTGSIYSGGDGVSQLEVYTPSNIPSNPKPGYAARRGSLHQSGSEDSNSLNSFCTDSDAGGPARSAVYCRSRRNMSNGHRRGVMSDSETTRPRKPNRFSGACLDMNIRVPEEEFFYRVRERLLAVGKDREAMTMKARDLARQRGESYDDIMAVEWFELPEARKYLLISNTPPEPVESSKVEGIPEDIVEDHDERPSSPRLTISPSELTPRSGIAELDSSRIRSTSSQHQLEDGMRTLHVGGMTKSRRSHRHLSGSSSVLSATSDSGVGDTWATSEMNTPPIDRIQAYLQRQSMLSTSLPPRERDAHAAAIALISNSPHPENLNPQVPMQHLSRQQQGRHHHPHYHQRDSEHHHSRQQQRVGNMPHYSSGDDSSSVFTITSQSSTSDLFIPRKAHQHPVYTDSEEPHHFGNNRTYRRMLTTPKRSHIKHSGGQGPSPLTEQHRPRMAQTPQQGDMLLSTPQQTQQQQQQQHSMGQGGSGNVGGGASSGTVHVIYHLDNIPTPFHAKWTNGVGITLGTFKDQVFARKGEYRFFFESFNPDLDMALLEEFTEDETCLPIIRGKIVGRVERAQ